MEEWESDFDKTKKGRNTTTPGKEKQAVNVAEPVNHDDTEQPTDGFEHTEMDVFMMESETDSEFLLMPGDDSTANGIAATAVAVCATCRMLLKECECRPRQRI